MVSVLANDERQGTGLGPDVHRDARQLMASDAPRAESATPQSEVRRSVLVVHNRYQLRGGEDVVFEAESALLEKNGHRVGQVIVDNSTIPESLGFLAQAQLAARTIWSPESAQTLRRAIRKFRPDVVHAHNTFPLMSPSIYGASAREGVPVVQTLHNYRLVCPKATLFRDGGPCEDCVGRTIPSPGIVHGCYQGSRPKSAIVAAMLGIHNTRATWDKISLFVALSEFSRQVFLRGGFPADRIVVKPNFVEPDPGGRKASGDSLVFVGRLSEEKGVDTLLRAAASEKSGNRLTIIGDGPLRAAVREFAASHSNIELLGPQQRPMVVAAMAAARAVIIPSLWYEAAAPLTLIEAFACGAPVIGSRLGALGEAVDHGKTGLLFEAGSHEALASAIRWMTENPTAAARMGDAARAKYLSTYTAAQNYPQLISLYDRAVGHSQTDELTT